MHVTLLVDDKKIKLEYAVDVLFNKSLRDAVESIGEHQKDWREIVIKIDRF